MIPCMERETKESCRRSGKGEKRSAAEVEVQRRGRLQETVNEHAARQYFNPVATGRIARSQRWNILLPPWNDALLLQR